MANPSSMSLGIETETFIPSTPLAGHWNGDSMIGVTSVLIRKVSHLGDVRPVHFQASQADEGQYRTPGHRQVDGQNKEGGVCLPGGEGEGVNCNNWSVVEVSNLNCVLGPIDCCPTYLDIAGKILGEGRHLEEKRQHGGGHIGKRGKIAPLMTLKSLTRFWS